jgi:hypothetical protein
MDIKAAGEGEFNQCIVLAENAVTFECGVGAAYGNQNAVTNSCFLRLGFSADPWQSRKFG